MITLVIIHYASTTFLMGLIWVVQIVQYPQFNQIGKDQFSSYEIDYQRRITFIVGPMMLVEITTAILLVWYDPSLMHRKLQWLNLFLLILVWISTAFLQVPCHRRLQKSFETQTHNRLVITNWIRTVIWTVRGILLSIVLVKALSHL